MAKPELGTKRLCGSCGAKFYDLSKTPIVCPKCGTVFEVVAPVAPRGRMREAAAAAAAAAQRHAPRPRKRPSVPETADVELVSLEDADAEAAGQEGRSAKVEGDDDRDRGDRGEPPSSRRRKRATTTSPTSSASPRTKRRPESQIGASDRPDSICTVADFRTSVRLDTAFPDGAIAQLGERLNGIQEVGGSTPPGSTKFSMISICYIGQRDQVVSNKNL